jgi:hypothetical protein
MLSNHSSVRMGCSSSHLLVDDEDGRLVDAVLGDSSIGWIPPQGGDGRRFITFIPMTMTILLPQSHPKSFRSFQSSAPLLNRYRRWGAGSCNSEVLLVVPTNAAVATFVVVVVNRILLLLLLPLVMGWANSTIYLYWLR